MPEIVDAEILLVKEVILAVFELTALFNEVILFVLELTELVNEVILFVADVILVLNVEIVDELTPPTVFTVGEAAVPLRSPANWIIPFAFCEASVGV